MLPPLTIDAAGLLANAAAGKPITLQVLDLNGNAVGPGAACDTTSASIALDTPAGIAVGGNKITGLGATGKTATAVDIDAIAFGNNAATNAAAVKSVAIGSDAKANVANSVALGAGSIAGRGAVAGYTALGLSGPQTSAGEVSVGIPGGERQITNVAAGLAPTDAANVAQLAAVGNLSVNAVQYDLDGFGNRINKVTLVGAVPGTVAVQNVSDGALNAASTDAVNGRQLFATNTQVDTNTTNIAGNTKSITNLSTSINNGTVGLVQQTGSAPGNGKITVGTATGGTVVNFAGTSGARTLSGVAAGVAVTDAVNVGQLGSTISTATANAVQYDADALGNRTNSVTLAGGAAGPVSVRNVADGAVTAASTDAVNGRQLFATNTQVDTNTTNIAGNTSSITNLSTSINNGTVGLVQQTGSAPGNGEITVGTATGGTVVNFAGTSGARTLSGVAAGVAVTDAVNVGQLAGITATTANAVQYDADALGNRTNSVTLAGGAAGPVAVRNVADGAVTAASTDAVNGRQLFATNTQVDTNTTNIAGNTSSITNLSTSINNGTVGLVQQTGSAPGNGEITVGTATGGTVVNFAGTSGARTLSGVAAGVAVTDAVNVGQLAGITAATANAVQYDADALGNRTNSVTLAGGAPGPVALRNVADGAVTAASTDAVNGRQLFATNTQVDTNTTNINNVINGTAGLLQQAGGSPGNGTLSVGAATGGTVVDFTGTGGTRTLSGISAGVAQTDAVNVSQLAAVGGVAANSVQYDVDASGARTNKVTLVGGNAAAPVTVGNVAAGALSATSTDAVNGAQLFATNTQVSANTTNIASNTSAITNLATSISNGTTGLVQQTGGAPGAGDITVGATTGGSVVNVAGTSGTRVVTGVAAGVGATDAVNVAQLAAVGQASLGAVQYDRNPDGSINRASITLDAAGAPSTIGNVAAGVRPLDAVNVTQLQAGLSSTLSSANSYTDARISGLAFDLNRVAKRAYAGTASAMALQAPIFAAPGQIAMRLGSGLYRGEYAMGASLRATADNGRWSVSTGVSGGANSGVAATAGIDFVLGH
ncbi:MAG: hypothetical protein ACRYG4_24425 [Janthinobacterium lividum]